MNAPQSSRQIVLLVEADQSARSQKESWLRAAGFEVLPCGGPGPPHYTCPAEILQDCPLVTEANVIVLDPWLASDTMMTGTPGAEVMLFYMGKGKALVVLSAPDDPLRPLSQDDLVVLTRSPGRDALVAAVRSLVSATSGR
jgi:hypothetical protein